MKVKGSFVSLRNLGRMLEDASLTFTALGRKFEVPSLTSTTLGRSFEGPSSTFVTFVQRFEGFPEISKVLRLPTFPLTLVFVDCNGVRNADDVCDL